jgi:outer membrane immunogenic protein
MQNSHASLERLTDHPSINPKTDTKWYRQASACDARMDFRISVAERFSWRTDMSKLFHTALGCSLLAMSIVANAADIVPTAPTSASPYYTPPPYYKPLPFNWTGFYIGANVGGAFIQGDVTDSRFGLNFNNRNNSFIGGGQVGYNYQIGAVVFGVEGDFDWIANNNTGSSVVTPTGIIGATANNPSWITTLAARFGYALDHWLFYGKAGGGWVGNNGLTLTNLRTGASIAGTNSNDGWLLGAGVEWAVTSNWTIKAEYDFLGLSNSSFTVPAQAPFLARDTINTGNRNVQMVQVGFNYLFNWGGY